MNRNITEAYSSSLEPQRQGEFFHRYILGVYSLYEKLIARFPEVLFESCASGGCRFDAGMLYYAPQCWASDDTDGTCFRKQFQEAGASFCCLAFIPANLYNGGRDTDSWQTED